MNLGDLVRIWKPGYGDHGRLGVIISHGLGTGIFTVAIPHPVNTLKVVEYDHWRLEKMSEEVLEKVNLVLTMKPVNSPNVGVTR